MKVGDRLTLVIEKPAAGGRMIARHNGAIVLVSAAIPGETVAVVIEKVQRGTAWARTLRVLEASADRVEPSGDWSCGGNVFAHIRYERQLAFKRDILIDGFTRIGHLTIPEPFEISGSPADGYRMRARLHVQEGRIGFFREGTHELCPPAETRQLLAATLDALAQLERALETLPRAQVSEIEVSENCSADQRAFHLELAPDTDPSRIGSLPPMKGVTGISCGTAHNPHALVLWGSPIVTDELAVPCASGRFVISLARHAHSFFQGNRFLLADLAAAVVDAVSPGRVLDLYAGVGLFAVAVAQRGGSTVMAIEGERSSADDLKRNASVLGDAIVARHQSVETFLGTERRIEADSVIVDPPRTGMTKEALAGAIALGARRVVYVSCDVATLARDARQLVDAEYELTHVRAFDLFPNTAHVETVAVFQK